MFFGSPQSPSQTEDSHLITSKLQADPPPSRNISIQQQHLPLPPRNEEAAATRHEGQHIVPRLLLVRAGGKLDSNSPSIPSNDSEHQYRNPPTLLLSWHQSRKLVLDPKARIKSFASAFIGNGHWLRSVTVRSCKLSGGRDEGGRMRMTCIRR